MLISEIKRMTIPSEPILVSIDGIDGSGKTTLADFLVKCIGCSVIHLDEYIDENQGAYVEFMRSTELQRAILETKKRSYCVLVEGICVLQVLEVIDLKPDCRIYIKKLRWGHYWNYGKIYEGAMTLKEKLSLQEESIRKFGELEGNSPIQEGEIALSGLMRNIISYHWNYRPEEKADIVFGNHR